MSSSFAALVRKERPYLLALFLLASALYWLVFETHGFEGVFVFQWNSWAKDALAFGLPLALLAGVVAGMREGLSRTREFLWHRPISPVLPILARAVTGSALLLAAPFAGAALVYLGDRLGPSAATGARVEVLGLFAVLGAYATALFLIGLAAFARRASWTALVTWTFLGLMLFGLHVGLEALEAGPWTRVVAMLAAGGLALIGALASAATPDDPDRPASLRWPTLALVTVGAAVFGSLTVGNWQHHFFVRFMIGQPAVGLTPEGELVLARYDWGTGRWDILDEAGRVVGELDDDQPRINAPWPRAFSASLIADGFLRSYHSTSQSIYAPNRERTLVFERDSRRLRVIDPERRGSFHPRQVFELAPEGAGFSAELTFLRSEYRRSEEQQALVVIDPRGQRLWRVDGAVPPVLEELPLPRGELPTGLETVWVRSGESRDARETLTSTNTRWQLLDGEWSEVLEFDSATTGSISLRGQSTDPLRPRIVVAAKDGRTREHTYELDTPRRKFQASMIGLLALARPPLLALGASFVEPIPLVENRTRTRDFESVRAALEDLELALPTTGNGARNSKLAFIDHVLSSGYRWLLALNLGLHALLAALVARDLAKRGAGRARIVPWCIALLVAGIWIGPLLALVETQRAWRKSRSGPAPAPLVSAA